MVRLQGVVIWRSVGANTALVWCDDGGPLALVEEVAHTCPRGAAPDIGDLVEMFCVEDSELRPCVSIVVTAVGAVADPGQTVRQAMRGQSGAAQGAVQPVPPLRLVHDAGADWPSPGPVTAPVAVGSEGTVWAPSLVAGSAR